MILLCAGAVGELVTAVSVQYLGYLGVVPVGMGLNWLYRLFRPQVRDAVDPATRRSGAAFAASLLGMLPNSAGTLLTLAIVFADTERRFDWLIAMSVLAMVISLAGASIYAVRNPRFGPLIERHAVRIAPIIMIAVGPYVLANTATDVPQ